MLATTLILTAALLTGGSQDPTPYTIDPTGITLPAGRTFDYHDVQDANFTTTTGHTINLHFEEGRSHALAGTNSIAWTQLGFQPGECISWVQLHGFNEHFGAGGQDPACIPTPQPEPSIDTTTPAEPTPSNEPEPTFAPTLDFEECPLTEDGIPQSPHGCDFDPTICNWDNCVGLEPPLEPLTPNSDTQDITITRPTPQDTPHPTPSDTPTPSTELADTGLTTTGALSAIALLVGGTIALALANRTHPPATREPTLPCGHEDHGWEGEHLLPITPQQTLRKVITCHICQSTYLLPEQDNA